MYYIMQKYKSAKDFKQIKNCVLTKNVGTVVNSQASLFCSVQRYEASYFMELSQWRDIPGAEGYNKRAKKEERFQSLLLEWLLKCPVAYDLSLSSSQTKQQT